MTVLCNAALICFHRRINSGTTSISFVILAQTLHTLPMKVEERHFKHMKVIVAIFSCFRNKWPVPVAARSKE